MIKLGNQVEDSVSGFKGIAVQRIEYLNGCVRIGVQSKVDKDGKLPALEYFDEQQLDSSSAASTGGDYDAPPAIQGPGRW